MEEANRSVGSTSENHEEKPEAGDNEKTEEPEDKDIDHQEEKEDKVDTEPNQSVQGVEGESEKADDPQDSLQIAWEVLELSRLIYLESCPTKKLELSDVHLSLGNVALEGEQMETALEEFAKCLKLREEGGADERRMAEAHFQLGLVNTFLPNKNKEAQEHYVAAKASLNQKVIHLQKEIKEKSSAIENLQEIIKELDGRILEVTELEEPKEETTTTQSSVGLQQPSLPPTLVNTLVPRKKAQPRGVTSNTTPNKRKADVLEVPEGGNPTKKLKETKET